MAERSSRPVDRDELQGSDRDDTPLVVVEEGPVSTRSTLVDHDAFDLVAPVDAERLPEPDIPIDGVGEDLDVAVDHTIASTGLLGGAIGTGADHHGIGIDEAAAGRTSGADGLEDMFLDPSQPDGDPTPPGSEQVADGKDGGTTYKWDGSPNYGRQPDPYKPGGKPDAGEPESATGKFFKDLFDWGGSDSKPKPDPPRPKDNYDEAPPGAGGDDDIDVTTWVPPVDTLADPLPDGVAPGVVTDGPLPPEVHAPIGGPDPVNPGIVDPVVVSGTPTVVPFDPETDPYAASAG